MPPKWGDHPTSLLKKAKKAVKKVSDPERQMMRKLRKHQRLHSSHRSSLRLETRMVSLSDQYVRSSQMIPRLWRLSVYCLQMVIITHAPIHSVPLSPIIIA